MNHSLVLSRPVFVNVISHIVHPVLASITVSSLGAGFFGDPVERLVGRSLIIKLICEVIENPASNSL